MVIDMLQHTRINGIINMDNALLFILILVLFLALQIIILPFDMLLKLMDTVIEQPLISVLCVNITDNLVLVLSVWQLMNEFQAMGKTLFLDSSSMETSQLRVK
ncbi:hypothetical protein ASV37_19240 [Enterobacter hormaechei subsp. steigerwaltii]|nr:hypothetical protein ASV37_19240 [Enterobacter hormaechei subsp. steigerwaltii]